MEDYRDLNRATRDERAPAHAASPDYGLDRFATDPEHLSDVVRFDLPLLGDIRGVTGVHLQCHMGTDTVSLSRLGAHMTGLDFSAASLAQARTLVARTGDDVAFVETEAPTVWDSPGTYVETDVAFTHTRTHEWNHGLGQLVTALLDDRLVLTGLVEHDSVPWEALPGRAERVELNEWRLADRPERLPHSYTLQPVRPR